MINAKMGLKIFFTYLFVLGVKVEGNPLNACMENIDFENGIDSFLKLRAEEQLNVACVNVTRYLNCFNDVLRNQTGFDLKQLAILLERTQAGKLFTVIVNMIDLKEELCTEGNELREGYFANSECYRNIDMDALKECQSQATITSKNLRYLLPEGGQSLEESCITSTIKIGCSGAIIREECGDQAFDVYKQMIKKTGFFQSGLCPSGLMQTLKTTFVDSLNMLESRKTVYRIILDMKRRRK